MNKKLKFSGHQTFAFRYGWLEKGISFVKSGMSFSDEKAVVELGVGKNMVASIKYWLEMFGLVNDGEVSDFALRMFDEEMGWDPFLEDNGSLWLLHWKLMSENNGISAGHVIFSHMHKPEFTKQDVAKTALKLFGHEKGMPSNNTLLRDIDCYLRSYCDTKVIKKNKVNEDSFNCPLLELGLIHSTNDSELYKFSIGQKVSLSPEIIGFALCEYMRRSNKSIMNIQNVLYHEGSPGQVFMLDENSLIDAIDSLKSSRYGDAFGYTESAGIFNVECRVSLDEAFDLLDSYYRGEL